MDWRWLQFILLWIQLSRCLVSGETNLPPVFSHDMNNHLLSEGTAVGTIVYVLEGQDPEGLPVKYGLVGTDKFQVNPETGEVTLVQPLDREVEDTLKFLVSVEDQVPGSTNNLVQEPVTVIVLDENDNPPVFKNSPYEVDIPEDEAVGATVLRNITVEDKDSVGDNLEVICVPADQWPDACEIFELVSDHSSSSQYSGALVLRRPLDYNEKQFYRFQLSASDGTQNSSAHVDVKVVDVQNTPPMFSGALNGALSEDAPVGTLALTVKAKDGDRAQPRNVLLELVNNPHDFFLLDAVSGELKTAKPLDREALLDPSSPLNLTVRATELVDGVPVISNLTSSIAAVTITIKDVNDEPPKFNHKEYFVEIPESLALLTPLPNLDMLVTDKDVGINSVFGLRLSDKQGAFIVEPATAAGTATVTLRLNSTLDYEDPNQRKFIVQVIAEELHTSPRLSSVSSLTVTVLDVNDNAPLFPQQVYRGSVSEDAKEGDVVLTVTATDRDSGRFGTQGIVYQLYGNGASLFTVDNRTGVVSVASCSTPGSVPCLDFDTRKDYFLHYKATDDDGAGQTTVVSVHISLLDANDNPPVFETQVYKASIDEDANKFEPELQVQARDIDVTSELRYAILETDTPFWIDALTGKLAVKPDASVQMETDDNHIVLTILATDGVHNATCLVEITIRDVNNHAPAFETARYVSEIAEDAPIGTEVTQVRASDMDTGINSEIKYSIQKGAFDAFVIDNTTGLVSVSAKLDYDKRNMYPIQIIASDLGMPSLTGTTELLVHVINVNDKLPFFTPTIQRAEVSADAELGTVVHNLVAVDPDIMANEQLAYKLSQTKQITAVDKNGKEVSEEGIFNNWFTITPNGSVVVSQNLDRNRAAVLTLPVTVVDTSATSEQSGDGELIITMVDVNRHSPQFSQAEFTEHIAEEPPVGSVLNTYLATDRETPISAIVIQPPNPYFTIDNVTGVVKTAQRIDYEKIQLITFTLVAYDSGVPQRSTAAPVQVLVTNVNDEDPKFAAESYEASLLENSPAGVLVVKVEATDADLGEYGTIRYSLTGEKSNLFNIDSATGEVRVAEGAIIDREEKSDIYLRVAATDAYGQKTSRTTTVPLHIRVLDANDNVPVFSQKVYKSTIAENLRVDPPAAILQVLADDKDEGVFGEVRYGIVDQSEPDTFRVDELTGIIYPTKPVKGGTTYQLTVSAKDAGGAQGETARIDINVLSVNKNSPEFLVPSPQLTTVEIDEEAAQADFLILTAKATDKDQGENGRISYYLKVDNRNVGETNEFVINRDTGELRTNTFLDRELNDSYQLVLVATDNGTPAMFESLHFLTIKLRDSNDNVPRFAKQHYEFSILENQPAAVIIGSVKATDKDSGEHGKVYYHILEGNSEGAFTLDRTQGLLRANTSFDREKQSEYNVIVYASNNPILEHAAAILNSIEKPENGSEHDGEEKGVAYIKVKILDENDNAPRFENKIYYAGVKHTARINEPILPVVAEDGDLEQNGTLTYMVASSHLYKFGASHSSGSVVPSPFNITQEGILMTAGYMSEYNQDRFVLDIIAQEIAPPHRQAKAQVYVWVIDRSALIRMVVSESCGAARGVAAALRRAAHIHLVPAAATSLKSAHDDANDEWCELHVHAVDPTQLRVLPVDQVLESIDNKYDSLKETFAKLGVETLVAYDSTAKMVDSFDPALAALIALLIVLFTGIVTFVVVCACLKHWVVPPPSLQSSKCESLSRRRILEELSSTENPLWVRQVLRPYEEQELTMHVFANAEDNLTNPPQADNTYATIQGSRTAERFGDYATLGGRESPSAMEAALGFQGSTFKPPSSDTPEPPPRPNVGMNQT